jgi:TRAP-type transport system small permease protein
MRRFPAGVVRVIEALLAAMLAIMLVMVLVNVVMRYGFSTGLSSTEELSRTLLVWLTFTGAVLAAYEGAHLGMGSLIDRLPAPARAACRALSEATVLLCCVLIFHGTWSQHEVNATNKSLTTGMPMIWIYGIGYVVSLGIGTISAWRLWGMVRSLGGASAAPQAGIAGDAAKPEAMP